MKTIFLSALVVLMCCTSIGQARVYSSFATNANRVKYHQQLLDNIRTALAMPLTDSTEAAWEDAFNAIELIAYKAEWVKQKIRIAFDTVARRNSFVHDAVMRDQAVVFPSTDLEKALMEMVYSIYPDIFKKEVLLALKQAPDSKVFAICAEYLFRAGESNIAIEEAAEMYQGDKMDGDLILRQLAKHIAGKDVFEKRDKILKDLLQGRYPGSTVLFSIQRHNRDYPGLLIIKDTNGNFLKDGTGTLVSFAQLARSLSNLPGYLTNGNTPQGIFRMDGFDVSKSNFIGPTTNIQLTMPYENSVRHFLKDSTVTDTIWTENLYRKLLPAGCINYEPLMETYYASKIGRTEIIAHGTAVDPEYYKGQPYYPYTPTAGCLCARETWFADGSRAISDQQKLVDAVKQAGGPDGYLIVIELNDDPRPVTLADVLRAGF